MDLLRVGQRFCNF